MQLTLDTSKFEAHQAIFISEIVEKIKIKLQEADVDPHKLEDLMQIIDQDNTILSTFVADAKIAYSGSGIIDDRQRPGWLANMLDSLWPF